MNQRALELFINADSKHKRTVGIITELLEPNHSVNAIALKHGLNRRSITAIKAKYLKQQSEA